jgi:hypothetical protein
VKITTPNPANTIAPKKPNAGDDLTTSSANNAARVAKNSKANNCGNVGGNTIKITKPFYFVNALNRKISKKF